MINNDIVKKLYPGAEGLVYEPMLIHASTDSQLLKACESGDYFAQLKKDGAFYQFIKGLNGECYLFGRTLSKKTGVLTEKIANVPHIKEALNILPNGSILVGEIYYPGGSSKNTVEIMGCLPAKAIERQNGTKGKIHYYIHDILMYDGVNLVSNKVSNENRYKILQKIFKQLGLNKYDFLELAEVWVDNLYERVGSALAAGEEGMVLKHKEGIYEPGKRPATNLKAKKVDFADVVIIGFEEPTREYYGKEIENWQYWVDTSDHEGRMPLGYYYGEPCVEAVTKPYYMGWHNARINIGAYDDTGRLYPIGTIHSGISDEMKRDMSENPQNYLNKVCAIQCMEVDSKEYTIRHGFFKYMREDKEATDCLIRDIFS